MKFQKTTLLVWLSLVFSQSDATYALIFVHLGKEIPTCIYPSLEQARYFNSDCPIYLLTDTFAYSRFDPTFMRQQNINLVNGDTIPTTHEHAAYRALIHLDSSHILAYTLERFFYLLDFCEEKKIEPLFHLENDTLLYADLEEWLPAFESSRLAVPFLSNAAAVPCFVFIKDTEALRSFLQYTLLWEKKYRGTGRHIAVSDMKAFAHYLRDRDSPHLTVLPTLMPEYSRFHHPRRSYEYSDNHTPLEFLASNSGLFPNALFDAATLGVFANGNDPKLFPNTKPGVVHFRSLFDPKHFSFYWGKDKKNRPVPYLLFRGTTYSIFNLHMHCKKLDGFTSFADIRTEFP